MGKLITEVSRGGGGGVDGEGRANLGKLVEIKCRLTGAVGARCRGDERGIDKRRLAAGAVDPF